ncbi:MAG: cryptochrome/photolyase family protein, partial [Pseudomonadota bacterium]
MSSLADIDRERDVVLMVEVADETDYVPHHPKKIAFLFSAMRHFAAELRDDGIAVDYVTLDDPDNAGSFEAELKRALKRHKPDRVIVTEPGEYRVEAAIQAWRDTIEVPVEVCPDTRFFCSRQAFADWAKGKKQLRMEMFYRWMRQHHGFLMDGEEPEGGRWNYDAENRKPPKAGLDFPGPMRFTADETTEAVLAMIEQRFGECFGDTRPFWFAVTRSQARRALDHFIKHSLEKFGDYQDAMIEGEDYLFHSALSQYLNCGLLSP